jgi:hypothetical protein
MVIKEQLYKMRNTQYENGLRELISYIKKFKNTKEMRMVEIGSYAGESTMIFAEDFKEVISIDPFINDYDPNDITCQYMDLTNVYNTFMSNISKYGNIKHIRKTSDDAYFDLKNEKFDFIYIDGMHTYDQVSKDIDSYKKLINYDGFLGGHDYHPVWQGVVDAINENVGIPDTTFNDTSWITRNNKMFLNIVTPCSRPENLHKISQSINIPKQNYRWLVIFDSDELPDKSLIPNNCETYLFKDINSIAGHSQRNFAINLIDYGHIYSNDDDTILHPNLWESIKNLNNDFISFKQNDKLGNLRLEGDKIMVNHIDSHNFIFSKNICEEIKFDKASYAADGIFAEECYNRAKTPIHLPIVLSIYNSLR